MTEFFPAERQSRLDLLLHLLANTRQTILLRGPEQSGKSYFVRQLEKQLNDTDLFVLVTATDLINAAMPLDVLTDAFDHLEGNKKQLLVRLEASSRAGRKVIVCIEDVHELEAAHFDFLFQLSDNYNCLHILLTSSDNLGESVESRCQLMGLEPLTQKQTSEYARMIVAKKGIDVADLAGFDEVILFIETGGLPGRINDVLEQMSHQPKAIDDKAPQQVKLLPYIGLASMAILVTVMLIYFLYPIEDDQALSPAIIKKAASEKKIKRLDGAGLRPNDAEQQKIKHPNEVVGIIDDSPLFLPLPEKTQKEAVVELDGPSKEKERKIVEAEPLITKPVAVTRTDKKTLPKEVSQVKKLTTLEINHRWLNSRDKNHFTLQLLGVSTEESARKFVRKHKGVEPLYYLQSQRNDGQWFIVVYGDFEGEQKVIEATQALPFSLAKIKPWRRKFEAIQGDVLVDE